MARKKVKLEWIVNDSARRATFKKRRKGLVKKVSELSTLCDVKACMIVYGPNEPQPEVWPSASDAMRVLARLKRLPEMEQSKKMLNQEGFMRQRIEKLKEQLRKQDKENRELETTLLMCQGLAGRSLHGLSANDITSLAWLVEIKVSEAQKRIGLVRKEMASKAVEMVKEEERVVVGRAVKEERVVAAGKQKTPLEAAMEELQRQEWFTEVMNSNEHMIPGAEEMVHPYVNYNNQWMDSYFTFN